MKNSICTKILLLLICFNILLFSTSCSLSDQRIQLTGDNINDYVSISLSFEPIYKVVAEKETDTYSSVVVSIVPKSNFSFENVTCSIKLGINPGWKVISPNDVIIDGIHILKISLDKNGYCKEHVTLQTKYNELYLTTPPHPGSYSSDYRLTATGTVIKKGFITDSFISALIISGTIAFSSFVFCATYAITNKSKRKLLKQKVSKERETIEQS